MNVDQGNVLERLGQVSERRKRRGVCPRNSAAVDDPKNEGLTPCRSQHLPPSLRISLSSCTAPIPASREALLAQGWRQTGLLPTRGCDP